MKDKKSEHINLLKRVLEQYKQDYEDASDEEKKLIKKKRAVIRRMIKNIETEGKK